METKNLIKSTLLWLWVVWVMFSNATKAATITEAMDGTINTLTICDENDNTKCITMMDRNLWATTNDITSTGSYWYHFQWWNNYGFSPFDDSMASNAQNTQVENCLSYWPSNPYNIWTFVKWFNDRCSPSNDNLWWWTWDSEDNNRWYNTDTMTAINVEDRKWPCDTWYHVPSRWEWTALMDLWSNSSTNWSMSYDAQFQSDFKLPFAGNRGGYDANVYGIGVFAMLWSSSPYVWNGYINAWYFDVEARWVNAAYNVDRANVNPVRCFKDSALGSSSSEGGDSEIVVNIAALNGGQNTCSGEDFIFPAITASPVVQTIKLAKKFQCIFWNAANKAVTLHLSGDLTDWNGNVIPWANIKLSNPEWTSTPTWLKNGTTAFSGQTFMWLWKTLFNKVENMIWEAQGSGVQIEITVPAWTPDGTYQWTIILDF